MTDRQRKTPKAARTAKGVSIARVGAKATPAKYPKSRCGRKLHLVWAIDIPEIRAGNPPPAITGAQALPHRAGNGRAAQ